MAASMREETRNQGQQGDRNDKSKDTGSAIGDFAGKAGTAIGNTADKVASAAGSGIKNLGETLAEKAPREGMFGSAAQAVAGSLKEGGKYLEKEGFSGMFEDVAGLIRRSPVPAVLVGIGLGFLLGRLVRT